MGDVCLDPAARDCLCSLGIFCPCISIPVCCLYILCQECNEDKEKEEGPNDTTVNRERLDQTVNLGYVWPLSRDDEADQRRKSSSWFGHVEV